MAAAALPSRQGIPKHELRNAEDPARMPSSSADRNSVLATRRPIPLPRPRNPAVNVPPAPARESLLPELALAGSTPSIAINHRPDIPGNTKRIVAVAHLPTARDTRAMRPNHRVHEEGKVTSGLEVLFCCEGLLGPRGERDDGVRDTTWERFKGGSGMDLRTARSFRAAVWRELRGDFGRKTEDPRIGDPLLGPHLRGSVAARP